jgi:hypothetical protein
MFPCSASRTLCYLSLPYPVAKFSNRFYAKQYTGTFLSITLSLAHLPSISMSLLMICIHLDDSLSLALSACHFAISVSILASNFPPNLSHVGAWERHEMDKSMIVFLLPKLTFTT